MGKMVGGGGQYVRVFILIMEQLVLFNGFDGSMVKSY